MIVKTNKKLEKILKESEKEDEEKEKRLARFSVLTEEQSTYNPRLSKINFDTKRSKEDVRKPLNSLRIYIEQKWNIFIALLFSYMIFIGASLSTPIVVNYFGFKSQNQTEKERFII